MIVVSDTTPLISLMKIGHLELLKKYFGEVQIPEAVFNELTVNERFTDEVKEIRNCQFIRVVKVNSLFGVVYLLKKDYNCTNKVGFKNCIGETK